MRAARDLGERGDNRCGVDHERHDVDHQDRVDAAHRVFQDRCEDRPEAVLSGVGQEVHRIRDGSFGRQHRAQPRQQRGGQLDEVQARLDGAVGREDAGAAGVRQHEHALADALRMQTERLPGEPQFSEARDAQHAGVGTERVGLGSTHGRRPGMAECPVTAGIGAPPDERDDRLHAGDPTGDLAKAHRVAERFDVQQDRAAHRIGAEIVDVVGEVEMHRIADRHDDAERDAGRVARGDHLFRNRAGLRDERHRTTGGQVAEEGRGEPGVGVEDIHESAAIGPTDQEIVLGRDAAEFCVARQPGLAGLGESARQDQQVAVPGRGGFAGDVGDGFGPHEHGDEIGGRRDFRQRRRRGQALDHAALRIDRHDAARPSGETQVAQHGAAGTRLALAGPDDRDAGRPEEGVEARTIDGHEAAAGTAPVDRA